MKSLFLLSSRALVLTAVLVMSRELLAAACCGGGSSGTAMITGDYQSQFSLSTSYSSVQAMQTKDKAVFWEDGHYQRTLTYKLSGATMIGERSQVGVSGEYLRKDYAFTSGSSESSSKIGDTTLQVGSELIAESYYTSLWPRALIALSHTLPTGTGLEESTKPGLSDVTGLGQHQSSLSFLLLKRRPSSLLSLKVEGHHKWRKVQSNQTAIGSSNGFSFELSATHLPPKSIWSYGLALSGIFNQGHLVERPNGVSYRSSYERVAEVALFSALSLPAESEVSLRYVDQTLLGPAKNSTLSRTVSLSLTKFIPL